MQLQLGSQPTVTSNRHKPHLPSLSLTSGMSGEFSADPFMSVSWRSERLAELSINVSANLNDFTKLDTADLLMFYTLATNSRLSIQPLAKQRQASFNTCEIQLNLLNG